MDAGKIRSLIPSVDLRADSGADAQSGRRSDAGALAKVAPLLALDSLLTSADADPKNDVHGMPALARPPSGVVVNLSLPALNAAAALQLARTVAPVTDYSHLDPHKPHPERSLADSVQEAAEPLAAAVAASPQPNDRAAPHAAPASTSPDARPDLHPHGVAHAAPLARRADVAEPKASVSALDQAREAERLAGLALAAERFAGTPSQLGKLALAAAILGALIVVVLL